MTKNKFPIGRRSEILVHPQGWKTLLRCVVIADNQSDALNIVQFHHPDEIIVEKDVIRWFLYPSPEQLSLFI